MTSKKSKAAVVSSQKLIRAIKNSQLKIVRRLVDHDSVDINATNDVGETPLHCAGRVGHLKIVQYLVKTGRTNLDATNKSVETILHLASRYGHVQVVQYLVESCGANVESSNNDGDTALHWACRYGHHRVVQYLVTTSQVSVEAANNEGWTALHIASRYARDLTIVEYLVETGGAYIHAVTKSDETALGVTKTSGLHSVVAYLQGRLEMAKSDGCTVEDSSYRLILERPSTWGNSPADSTNVAVPVSQLDDQYWTVAQKLQETIPDAHISALWRIQNTALWWYYSFHKHRMALSGTAANEMALWHGTRQVDPSAIYNDQQDGFMVQHSKDGYWGHGIYFAEKSQYSHDFAFHPSTQPDSSNDRPLAGDDEREMFLAKVLVGSAIEMNRDESSQKDLECRALRAAPINDKTNLRYNTVTGSTQGSRVWIVYENGRAYPEFLVRYYRNPCRDLHRTRYGSLEEAARHHNPDGAATASNAKGCVVYWEYMDDADTWNQYSAEHKTVLEDAYQQYLSDNDTDAQVVNIQGTEWAYQVNLATMVQTNVEHSNRTQRLVQRRLVAPTTDAVAAFCTWEYEDDGDWKRYLHHHQSALEDAYQNYVEDSTGLARIAAIRTTEWAYHVDLFTMVQTNMQHHNHTQRHVRRRVITAF